VLVRESPPPPRESFDTGPIDGTPTLGIVLAEDVVDPGYIGSPMMFGSPGIAYIPFAIAIRLSRLRTQPITSPQWDIDCSVHLSLHEVQLSV
jgi:hypothetical protein